MTIARATLLAFALTLTAALPAAATATLTCEAEDRTVAFSLQGNIGRGAGAVLQITSGSIRLKAVRGKYEAIEFEIEPAQLVQQWVFEKELRIGIQSAEKQEMSLYLAIIAQQMKSSGDGDRYQGRYVLKIQGPKGTSELKGRINNCEAG